MPNKLWLRGPDAPQRWALLQGGAQLCSVGDPPALPRSESAHARGGHWRGRLACNQTSNGMSLCRFRKGRGLRRTRPGTQQPRGCPALPSFRRAPPRPASRGLARPRCHVGLCGCRRRRRRRRTGGVGSLAQPPECEDNDRPARAEQGGCPELPCRRAARGRRPSALSLGLRAPPEERRRDAAAVTAAGSRPCHPPWDPSARPPPEETTLDAPPHRRHHELGPAAPAEGHQRGLPAAHPARERVSLLLPRQEMCGQ